MTNEIFIVRGATVEIIDSKWNEPVLHEENHTLDGWQEYGWLKTQGPAIKVENNGTLILNRVTIISETGNVINAGDASSAGNVKIMNAAIQGQESAIEITHDNSSLIIEDGIFVGKDNATISDVKNGGKTSVTINNGKFVGLIESAGYLACAIYHTQDSVWTINNCDIQAFSGIGILCKAGDVIINNANITVTGQEKGKIKDVRPTLRPFALALYITEELPESANAYMLVKDGWYQGLDGAHVCSIGWDNMNIHAERGLRLEGGLFSEAPGNFFVTQPYHAVQVEENKWQVVKDDE